MPYEEYTARPVRTDTSSNCLRTAGISCLVVFVIGLALLAWGLFALLQNSAFRQAYKEGKAMAECRMRLAEVGAALERYERRNGKYPDRLEDLYPNFLEKRDFLHCPSDPSAIENVSYIYHRPPANASGNTLVAECKRWHVLGKDQSAITLKLYKNGQVKTPDYKFPAEPSGGR